MADIFLSYTEKDRDKARRLAATLESVGWTVWWDRRIPTGETWRNVLHRALHEMRCMVVLWSAQSIESEWVYEEASEGRRLEKLVPVLIEQVRPPAGFREIQTADLTGWTGSADHDGLRILVADLERLLGKPGADRRTDTTPAANRTEHAAVDRVAAHGRPYDPADLATTNPPVGSQTLRVWLPWAMAGVLVVAAAAVYVSLSPPTPKPEPVREPVSPPRESSLPQTRTDTMSAPTGPTIATPPPEAVPLPKPEPKTESKKPDPATRTPPRAASESKRPEERSRTNPRCSALLEKIQLGEPLSDEATATFKKECSQ